MILNSKSNKKAIAYHLISVFLIMFIIMLLFNIKNSIETYTYNYNNALENRTITINESDVSLYKYKDSIFSVEKKDGFIKIVFNLAHDKKEFMEQEWKKFSYLEASEAKDSNKIEKIDFYLNLLFYFALFLSIILIIAFNFQFLSIIKIDINIFNILGYKLSKTLWVIYFFIFFSYFTLNLLSYVLVSNVKFNLYEIIINNHLTVVINYLYLFFIAFILFFIYNLSLKKKLKN